VDNYSLGAGFSCAAYKGRGVCIFLRMDIIYSSMDVSHYYDEKNIELCAVELSFITSNIILLCIYRSPTGDFNQFIKRLDLTLKNLYKPPYKFTLCGDFNINYLLDSCRKNQLTLLLDTYNLSHKSCFHTRFLGGKWSTLDNIFVDNARLGYFTVFPIVNGLSDHDGPYLPLKENTFKQDSKNGLLYRSTSITKNSTQNFLYVLKNET
jgi:hypothetical protein